MERPPEFTEEEARIIASRLRAAYKVMVTDRIPNAKTDTLPQQTRAKE